MKSHRIFSQRTHPIHRWTLNSCSGAFRNVSVHLRPFCYCMKLGANRAELVQLMQKFVQWSRIWIFCNEGTRSIPLDPKLMFWSVSKCLGAFGTISLLRETRCKPGRTVEINAKVRAAKSRRNFSQQRHPIHAIGSQTHVLVHFIMVWVHLDHFITAQNSVQIGSN